MTQQIPPGVNHEIRDQQLHRIRTSLTQPFQIKKYFKSYKSIFTDTPLNEMKTDQPRLIQSPYTCQATVTRNVLLLGDPSSGKSSLIKSICLMRPITPGANYIPTSSCISHQYQIRFSDTNMVLRIIDTPGLPMSFPNEDVIQEQDGLIELALCNIKMMMTSISMIILVIRMDDHRTAISSLIRRLICDYPNNCGFLFTHADDGSDETDKGWLQSKIATEWWGAYVLGKPTMIFYTGGVSDDVKGLQHRRCWDHQNKRIIKLLTALDRCSEIDLLKDSGIMRIRLSMMEYEKMIIGLRLMKDAYLRNIELLKSELSDSCGASEPEGVNIDLMCKARELLRSMQTLDLDWKIEVNNPDLMAHLFRTRHYEMIMHNHVDNTNEYISDLKDLCDDSRRLIKMICPSRDK